MSVRKDVLSEPSSICRVIRLLLSYFAFVLSSVARARNQLSLFLCQQSEAHFALEELYLRKHDIYAVSEYVADKLIISIF